MIQIAHLPPVRNVHRVDGVAVVSLTAHVDVYLIYCLLLRSTSFSTSLMMNVCKLVEAMQTVVVEQALCLGFGAFLLGPGY